MSEQYFNPFAAMNLVYPVEQRDDYERYCQPGASVDRSPFPRMVDLWFAGLSLGAREGLRRELSRRETSNFERGAIFDRDSWRVQVVMLVAIAVVKDVAVVGEPNRMIAIANEVAAAGVPRIVELLQEEELDPIWSLSEGLGRVLRGE